MKADPNYTKLEEVLLLGSDSLTSSIAVNLIESGHRVTVIAHEKDLLSEKIENDLQYISNNRVSVFEPEFRILDEFPVKISVRLAILIGPENLTEKSKMINRVEKVVPPDTVIAINTESIPLAQLQKNKLHAERMIGLNWVEPTYNTFFLEMIKNDQSSQKAIDYVKKLAIDFWNKNPYVIEGELGIRSRIFASMLREAFYLLENGYASVEDIDRAFRNDAGFYLPFCGNLRYMDLMGTYAYGLVMKDLNPDLAKSEDLPSSVEDLIADKAYGMEAQRGFYEYSEKEVKEWRQLAKTFSFKIKDLMAQYPFDYKEK